MEVSIMNHDAFADPTCALISANTLHHPVILEQSDESRLRSVGARSDGSDSLLSLPDALGVLFLPRLNATLSVRTIGDSLIVETVDLDALEVRHAVLRLPARFSDSELFDFCIDSRSSGAAFLRLISSTAEIYDVRCNAEECDIELVPVLPIRTRLPEDIELLHLDSSLGTIVAQQQSSLPGSHLTVMYWANLETYRYKWLDGSFLDATPERICVLSYIHDQASISILDMSTASQLTQVDILYPVLAGRFLSGRDVILVVDNVESQQLAWLNIDDSELMLVSGPLGKITLGANVRGRVLFSYSGSISGSGWGTVQLTQ